LQRRRQEGADGECGSGKSVGCGDGPGIDAALDAPSGGDLGDVRCRLQPGGDGGAGWSVLCVADSESRGSGCGRLARAVRDSPRGRLRQARGAAADTSRGTEAPASESGEGGEVTRLAW